MTRRYEPFSRSCDSAVDHCGGLRWTPFLRTKQTRAKAQPASLATIGIIISSGGDRTEPPDSGSEREAIWIDVASYDPPTFVAVSLLLAAITLLACYLQPRHPTVALRGRMSDDLGPHLTRSNRKFRTRPESRVNPAICPLASRRKRRLPTSSPVSQSAPIGVSGRGAG